MSVTIIDVAQKAGVSKSTVSLVLQDSASISPETKKKVRQAVGELGYVPNMSARSLITRRTNNIGIIIIAAQQPNLSYDFDMGHHLYQSDILDGIPPKMENTEYGLLLEQYCVSTLDMTGNLPNCIQNKRVDGVIFLGGLFSDAFIKSLKATGIPVAVVGSSNENFDCVITDHYRSAFEMTERLLNTGHKRICFLDCPTRYSSYLSHKQGFETCLLQNRDDSVLSWYVNSLRNTGQSGYEALKDLWQQGIRPDAVIGANGMIMMGAVRFLAETGVRLPQDISLIVHEDSILTSYAVPPISGMNVQKELMGGKACELLLQRLEDPTLARRCLITPSYYVDRGSVLPR